jgi:protein involved in polysaccharide export with SLBB domain
MPVRHARPPGGAKRQNIPCAPGRRNARLGGTHLLRPRIHRIIQGLRSLSPQPPRQTVNQFRIRLVLLAFALLAAARPAAAQPGTDALTLQPGDLLRITIWREPDLSGDFTVDERGRITLPLLGALQVAQVPVGTLRDTLISRYARELRNPSINIVPLRRVNVLGEVTRPGLYPVDPTMTLADVVAMAGGTGPTGDLRAIRLVRDGTVILERVEPGMPLTTADVRSGDQVFVGRRSWLDRNSGTLLATVLSATISIIASLIIANSANSNSN